MVHISALCAFIKSMLPIVAIADFYPSGSGWRPYSAAALDCTVTFSQRAALDTKLAVQRAGKGDERKGAGSLGGQRPKPIAVSVNNITLQIWPTECQPSRPIMLALSKITSLAVTYTAGLRGPVKLSKSR